MKAYYDPTVPMTNTGTRPQARDYETAIPVEKGQELGAFEMGSTVILLFEPGRVALDARLAPGLKLRVGEPIGTAGR